MVGWHHQLNQHEFEKTLGVGDEHGSLACCSPWGHKESDTTEWLNNKNKCMCWSVLSRNPKRTLQISRILSVCSFLLFSAHACKLDLHHSLQTLGIVSSTEKSSGLYLDSLYHEHHKLELFQGSKLKQWLRSLHLFPVFQGCLFFVAWSPIFLKSIVSYILYSFDFFTRACVCVCVFGSYCSILTRSENLLIHYLWCW